MPHSIRTERLLLRPATLRDAKGLTAALGHYDLARQTGTLPHPLTEEFMREKLRGMMAKDGATEFGFVMMLAGKIIGHLGFGQRKSGDWDIGYSLMPEHWGRGLGTESVHALCTFGFRTLGLNLVKADVFHDNEASIRVLRKCGFRRCKGRPDAFSLARSVRVPVLNFELIREGGSAYAA